MLFLFAYGNILLMNKLENYRINQGLTYAELGERIGVQRNVSWKHCQATVIPAEAAVLYSAALKIPIQDLRPDLPVPVTAPEQRA